MTFNQPPVNQMNYEINQFNMQQPKYVQNIQKSQQNFFPSALNRKFTPNQNTNNNIFNTTSINNNFPSNSFKNRNNNQEYFKQNKNYDYFNANNQNNPIQLGNNFIQNSKIRPNNNFLSDQFNQINFNPPQEGSILIFNHFNLKIKNLFFNQLELNSLQNNPFLKEHQQQSTAIVTNFFNSNPEEYNRMSGQNKPNIWPTNLPFNLPLEETKNENLFQKYK
jgi:hypothetical protein